MTFDTIIRGGRVHDGLGSTPIRADVGILGDRVSAIGDLYQAQADRTIDAEGLAVAPGFIDIHGHSDLSCLVGPRCESKVHQGVTTELCGACGYSPAPISPECRAEMQAGQLVSAVELEWTWLTFAEYLATVEAAGVSMNTVHLVGHTPIRQTVMGDETRPATPDEMEQMARLVAQGLEEGGVGFSSGLIYPPGSFATTEELSRLALEAGRRGRGYYTHIRNEGDHLLEAVDEAIRIGRESGCFVEIAHHKAAGRSNWGKVHDSVALMERARAEGVDVKYDVYPYLAGSTTLTAQLPDYVHEGGRTEMLRRLADPSERARIIEALGGEEPPTGDGEDRWAAVMVAGVHGEADRHLEGMTVREIATLWGRPAIETMMDLLLANDGRVTSVNFGMCEDDMEFVLSHPLAAVGSDSSAISAVDGVRYGKPHPRAYGTFPRVLGQLSRDRSLMPLPEAVRKMTSEPAARLRLRDRGVLREGVFADVTVFDPRTIADQATYREPHCFPSGIPYVLVNGRVVVAQSTHTDAPAGRVLRPEG